MMMIARTGIYQKQKKGQISIDIRVKRKTISNDTHTERQRERRKTKTTSFRRRIFSILESGVYILNLTMTRKSFSQLVIHSSLHIYKHCNNLTRVDKKYDSLLLPSSSFVWIGTTTNVPNGIFTMMWNFSVFHSEHF